MAESEHDEVEEDGEEAGEEQDDVENEEAEDEGVAEDEQEEETEGVAKPRKRRRRSSAQVLNAVFSFLLPVLPIKVLVNLQVIKTDYELGRFANCEVKTYKTEIQRSFVPYLIAIFGLSHKFTPMVVVQEMFWQ